jgi:hypothetical protein
LLLSHTDLLSEDKTVMELLDVDPELFSRIADWLYTGQIPELEIKHSWKDIVNL